MDYHASGLHVIKTPKMKLMGNRTIQWFLFGDPAFIDKALNSALCDVEKSIEDQMRQIFLFGSTKQI